MNTVMAMKSGELMEHKEAGSQSSLTVSRPELLVDNNDMAFRQLIHDTLAFASRVQEVRNRLGSVIGLTGTAFTILISIRHLQEEEGVGVNRLAEHLHLSGAFVTIEVNKLVAGGLVKKRTNPNDRRRVQLTVTQKAKDLLQTLTEVQRPANDVLFGDLTAEEFHILRDLTARLVVSGDRALSLLDYVAGRSAK